MNGLPYYKAYPRDFIEGTIGMAFEVKGAYRLILDLIYMQGGNLPDDARYISGALGCSVKKWNGLREKLIEAGKIEVRGGYLGNHRADLELEILAKLQDQQREIRSRPNKIKMMQSPQIHQSEPEAESEPDKKKEDAYASLSDEASNAAADKPSLDDSNEAFALFNETAGRVGWPGAQRLNATRRRSLRGRLNELGGITGWKLALEKAEQSDFLCGRTAPPWNGFGFDWLIQPKNLTKLMEGNYDNRNHSYGPDRAASRVQTRGADKPVSGLIGAVLRREAAGKR